MRVMFAADICWNVISELGHDMITADLEFLAANSTPDYKIKIDRIFEGYYGLQYVDAGGVDLRIDDRKYMLEGQWAWCTFPGPHFKYKPTRKHGYWSHHYITFRGPRADIWVAEGLLPFEPMEVRMAGLGSRMDHIGDLLNSGERFATVTAVNELEAIILDLAKSNTAVANHPDWLINLIKHLNESIQEQPDYGSLAEKYCMSQSTLRRQFKEYTGEPIHTYLLRKRIHTACEMLVHTDMSIKCIAQKLGYRDIYFFSRQFHKFTGLTPGQFRQTK